MGKRAAATTVAAAPAKRTKVAGGGVTKKQVVASKKTTTTASPPPVTATSSSSTTAAASSSPMDGLNRDAIKRMARRAGITRMDADLCDAVRALVSTWLDDACHRLSVVLKLSGRTTIKEDDVHIALQSMNADIVGGHRRALSRRTRMSPL